MNDESERLRRLSSQYVAAQLAGNSRAALRLVLDEALGQGVDIKMVYLDILQAAQYQIGMLWQQNQISVAQEHMATAISQLVLAHLYPALPRRPSNQKLILLGCPAGEHHDLGARMCADFFEMAGFDVHYLGANVPTESLLAMVRSEQPDLLALSATMTFNLPALSDAVLRSREAGGNGLRITAGGHALSWSRQMASRLDLTVADTLEETVSVAQRSLGVEAAA